jgi:hypothetical protein
MPRIEGDKKPRGARNFYAPVWITVAVFAVVLSFMLGGYMVEDQRSHDDSSELALSAMKGPRYTLMEAAQRLEDGRIEFPLYRDLLKAALNQPDDSLRPAVIESAAVVLNVKNRFADYLKDEFKPQRPRVVVTTADAAAFAGGNIERDLNRLGWDVRFQKPQDPKQTLKTEVRCYDNEACTQTAQSVVYVLQANGYDVGSWVKNKDEKFDEATTLFNKSLINVVLAEIKKPNPAPAQVAHPAGRRSPRRAG